MPRRSQDPNHYVPDVLRQAGMTYRQMDYWIRRGYLRPVEGHPGNGHPRQWSPEELEAGRRMAVLVRGGYTPAAAARLVRLGTAPGQQEVLPAS